MDENAQKRYTDQKGQEAMDYYGWKEGREEKQGTERADSNVSFLYTFWSEPGSDAGEYCEYSL